MPYLTGGVLSAAAICRRVLIPDDEYFRQAVYGALLELTYTYNWQEFGVGTPEDYAAAAVEMFAQFMTDGECEVSVSMLGHIFPYAGDPDTLPAHLLLCDGAQYTQAQYPDLYAMLDPTFKNISNQTFVVPDLRGKTVIGHGQGSGLTNRIIGQSGGAETHTLNLNEIPSHTHGSRISTATGGATTRPNGVTVSSGFVAAEPTQTAGGGLSHNNMQPYSVLPYVIWATS